MKIANIDREILHIFWTTWGISVKFSGKMCFMITQVYNFWQSFGYNDEKCHSYIIEWCWFQKWTQNFCNGSIFLAKLTFIFVQCTYSSGIAKYTESGILPLSVTDITSRNETEQS